MRCPTVALVVVLGGLPTAGCSLVGDPCAAPVTGTATYVSGSTPPPWHHEWTVRLDASTGSVTWTPGYGSSESWTATFTPEAGAVVTACRTLRDAGDEDTPTGGGTLTVRWLGADGRATSVMTSDERFTDAVRGAVPPAAWGEAQGAYERWRDAQPR